jgi:hypothetical protein
MSESFEEKFQGLKRKLAEGKEWLNWSDFTPDELEIIEWLLDEAEELQDAYWDDKRESLKAYLDQC